LTLGLRVSSIAALVTAAAIGCSKDHPQPTCPRNQPAFRLQLTAPGGALPADTKLTVSHSGCRATDLQCAASGRETYSLATGGPMNTDICCRTGDPTKGRLPNVPCGLSPGLSSTGPAPRPLLDASSSRSDGSASLPPDGAHPTAVPDATAPTTRDAALTVRDGAIVTTLEAGMRDAAGSPGDSAADAAPSGPVALLCDLWTDGYADVKITASGYPDFEHRPFEVNIPDPQCGVVTRDLRIELGHTDAGVNP
jgi:hypothetical protein